MHYRYLTLEQRENLERLLDGALAPERARLHSPEYGVCVACGKDIPYARLLEIPAARHCSGCQPKN